LGAAVGVGCGGLEVSEVEAVEAATATAETTGSVPPRGGPRTLDVVSWNVAWFGSPTEGPRDEGLQLENVRVVLAGTDADLWGLVEIVGAGAFDQLVRGLDGYGGLLASDVRVTDGARFYAPDAQKPALVWKRALATLLDARLILTDAVADFAGRPPLEARFRIALDGVHELTVVVLHAKASADVPSWRRRQRAAAALAAHLRGFGASQRVIVVGDFNDDVDVSITPGRDTPYRALLDAAPLLSFPTLALSTAGRSSTVMHREMIDHHLVNAPLFRLFVSGSAEVFTLYAYIPRFRWTTSDHHPVLTRYRWPR
jgi:endonuclease/exonuclease/phosphatase family metal-dependent hydrolase